MRQVCIYTVVAMAVLFSSCRREGRVIPRDKMAIIYAELFIADQRINQDNDARKVADTSFVYAPVFEKHGYTVADYRASMAYYIKDPDRYARILRKTASIIEKDIKALKKEKERLEELEKLREEVSVFRPDRIFRLTGLDNPDLFTEDILSFYVDSTGGELYFDVRKWMDTAFYGPVMQVRDTLSVHDSMTVELPGYGSSGDVAVSSVAEQDGSAVPGRKSDVPAKKPLLNQADEMKINDKLENVKERK